MARRISAEVNGALPYLGAYFIASQIFLLYLVYVFTKVDWRAVFFEKRFRWLRDSKRSVGA